MSDFPPPDGSQRDGEGLARPLTDSPSLKPSDLERAIQTIRDSALLMEAAYRDMSRKLHDAPSDEARFKALFGIGMQDVIRMNNGEFDA